jgi:hypothetical protein
MTMAETSPGAYDRGVKAGEIAEQLRRHDIHFSEINGSIDRTARALEGLRLDVQRLADQAESDAKTRIATAQALKDAEDVRRNTAETRWTPVQRGIAVLGALLTAAGFALALYLATGR